MRIVKAYWGYEQWDRGIRIKRWRTLDEIPEHYRKLIQRGE